MFFVFSSIPNQYKTKEMYNSIICDDSFLIILVPDQYKTQKICDKAVDDCLAALKFAPDWIFTRKMIKTLYSVVFRWKYTLDNLNHFNQRWLNTNPVD